MGRKHFVSNIIRRQRSTWTTVDNRIINDRRLSMKALGLLVYMLSKPDNWEFSQESLGEWFDEGREAMRTVMKSLSGAGYIRREIVRCAGGQLRTLTIVTEEPDTGFPAPVEPAPADPPAGQPVALVKTDSVKTDAVNTEESIVGAKPRGRRARREYSPGFCEAWDAYPPKPDVSKPAAWRAWCARVNEGVEERRMIDGVKRYAEFCKATRRDPQYIKHPSTFLGPDLHFDGEFAVQGTIRAASKSIAGMNYSEGVDEHGNIL